MVKGTYFVCPHLERISRVLFRSSEKKRRSWICVYLKRGVFGRRKGRAFEKILGIFLYWIDILKGVLYPFDLAHAGWDHNSACVTYTIKEAVFCPNLTELCGSCRASSTLAWNIVVTKVMAWASQALNCKRTDGCNKELRWRFLFENLFKSNYCLLNSPEALRIFLLNRCKAVRCCGKLEIFTNKVQTASILLKQLIGYIQWLLA